MHTFAKLFTPGKIGKVEVKNRILQAPMATSSYDDNGIPSEQTLNYYAERAKGGVGLIICHAVRATPSSRTTGVVGLFEDRQIPIMSQISTAIHDAGAKCALQINHSGRTSISEPLAPSSMLYVKTGVMSKQMPKEEIRMFIELFSDTARRVMQAGFDMVELHAAHGYLMSSFLSPYTNRRSDEYGGSPQNRARFICEILERIRDKVGSDFPVSVRFSGADFLPGGTTVEDSIIQAPLFEKAGASLLNVSAGTAENTEVQFLSYLWPDAYITDLAAQVKAVVKIPVCTAGKLGDPVIANQVLEEGKADFISLARPLLADPYWPDKAKHGKIDDIIRCIYCNNCWDRLHTVDPDKEGSRKHKRLFCTVNPVLFHEKEYLVKKVASLKKVMVIGGGLAGMQAAKVAAQRGHSVTLYEASGELGGVWNIAAAQPFKEGYCNLTNQLIRGIKESGVKVVLGKKVDTQFVKAERPDAVIVATGAKPITPEVLGADGPNVIQAVDVILDKVQSGERVVVIGGCTVGIETALQLAEKGKKVSLITPKRLGENGRTLEGNIYRTLRDRMIKHGVHIFPNTPTIEIRSNGVFANDGGNILWLPADTVVLAVGFKSEKKLAEELNGVIPELYTIGDCNAPRDGLDAMREGMEVGLKV